MAGGLLPPGGNVPKVQDKLLKFLKAETTKLKL
jgi:hypothetical protein